MMKNIFFRIKLLVTHLFHSRIAPGVRFTVQFAEELLTFVRIACQIQPEHVRKSKDIRPKSIAFAKRSQARQAN